MASPRIDYKDQIELISGLKVYPVFVPDKAKYPCIQMNISGGKRDGDSSMNGGSRISNFRLSLTILSPTASEAYRVEDLLKEGLDEKPLKTLNTNTLIMYFDNSVELYNYQQSLFEVTVDFLPKKLN
jgi:hypothetical protein